MRLRGAGEPRTLPARLLGFNTPVPYGLPWEDPSIVPLVQELAPGLLRYPGGSVANFWDWREGQLRVPEADGESRYRTFVRQMQEPSRRRHPHGCPIERFAAFCSEVGAGLVVVPNLETSGIDEQAAFFAHMRSAGVVPSLVEMGNEFWIAMLGDAESMRRFPDWETSLRITRDYLDGMRPHLPGDVKIAVQSAGTRFYNEVEPPAPLGQRMWRWDDDLATHDWFDAVTVHLYPAVQGVFGRGDAPEDPEDVCRGLVARADSGTERLFAHLDSAVPGIQVWVTEWGVEAAGQMIRGERTGFTGMWIHVLARLMLALIRHPSVTIAQYHALFFDGSVYALFRRNRESGAYERIGPATLMEWFNTTANGAAYERLVVDGVDTVAGGGLLDERFAEVEAASFTRDGRATLLLHNATGGERVVELPGRAAHAQALVAHPGADLSRTVPDVVELPARSSLKLPAWSVTRTTME